MDLPEVLEVEKVGEIGDVGLDAHVPGQGVTAVPHSGECRREDFVATASELSANVAPTPATVHCPMNEHECRHRPTIMQHAECDVAVGVTIEKRIGRHRTLTLVDVGGAAYDDDGGSLPDRAAIGQFRVLRCDTRDAEWHQRLLTKQLFDRAGDAIGVAGDLAAMPLDQSSRMCRRSSPMRLCLGAGRCLEPAPDGLINPLRCKDCNTTRAPTTTGDEPPWLQRRSIR